MTIKEMSNEQLFRYYICAKKELKTMQSTIRQYEDELNKRFDNQELVERKEENE